MHTPGKGQIPPPQNKKAQNARERKKTHRGWQPGGEKKKWRQLLSQGKQKPKQNIHTATPAKQM